MKTKTLVPTFFNLVNIPQKEVGIPFMEEYFEHVLSKKVYNFQTNKVFWDNSQTCHGGVMSDNIEDRLDEIKKEEEKGLYKNMYRLLYSSPPGSTIVNSLFGVALQLISYETDDGVRVKVSDTGQNYDMFEETIDESVTDDGLCVTRTGYNIV